MSTPVPGARITRPLRYTQSDLDAFADLSGDHNPIHVDAAHPSSERFGGTVAHGMLLFASLGAAVARWTEKPFRPTRQTLVFPAPTFVERSYTILLEEAAVDGAHGIAQKVYDEDDTETVVGFASFAPGPVPAPAPAVPRGTATFKGLRAGMSASRTRRFTTLDVAKLDALVGPDGNGSGIVPPPLLGGVVSALLGMELPGPGAKWLKQDYAFMGDAAVGEEVAFRVTVTRLRPAKGLVDLAVEASAATTVLTGRALVLAVDIEQPP